MTAQELLAKITGVEGKITALEADKAITTTALAAETEARKATEQKLSEVQAELSKIKATAPPPPPAKKEGEENTEDAPDIKDAIDTLEKAIENWKKIAGAEGSGDDESKAEGEMDSSDDSEATTARTAKQFSKVLAIRAKQAVRVEARAKKIQAVRAEKTRQTEITAAMAKLGIPMPLAMKKDGKSPILAEASSRSRAHRLTASGFNEQPSVAALNQSLGRVVRN